MKIIKSRESPVIHGKRLAGLWPILLLLALVALSLVAHFLEWWEWRPVLQWARGHAQQGWLVAALILLQVVLFMFALPGSSLIWVVAALYPPLGATLILVAGASAGGVAGYLFASRLSASRLAQLRDSRLFILLRAHGDFFTQCALRLMPGFPHSIINYGAGILRLPLGRFAAAAVLGIGVKTFLYTSVIHHALGAAEPAELLRIDIVAPLVLLALLLLLAGLIQRRRAANTFGR